ncbi:unnamed protein product [Victoria cruziana]
MIGRRSPRNAGKQKHGRETKCSWQQDGLPKYALTCTSDGRYEKKGETLDRFCRPIITKPRPAPPSPRQPKPLNTLLSSSNMPLDPTR